MKHPLVHPIPKHFPPKQSAVSCHLIMQMEENEETSVISLRVNSEQKEAIIQFFNFND